MILREVAAELLDAVSVTGVQVGDWGDTVPRPPAAILAMPERIDLNDAGKRGMERAPDWELMVCVGGPTTARALQDAADYASSSGPKSVTAALEARRGQWQTFTHVRPVYVEFVVVTYAGTDLLAASFHLDIGGSA